jgi:hypothetical protein
MPLKPPYSYDLKTYRTPVFRTAIAMLDKDYDVTDDLGPLVEMHGVEAFLYFLQVNGLASIFHTHFSLIKNQIQDSDVLLDSLKTKSKTDAVRYLTQTSTLALMDKSFRAAGINYKVFKGAATRERVYPEPWIRPSADVDVLVAKDDKEKAIQVLVKAGMRYRPNAEVLSHEATLTYLKAAVDLHWDIMRPGRTRVDMTDALLSGVGDNRLMEPTKNLFVLLVQPAINKYVCSPEATLVKYLDLHLSLKSADFDPLELAHLLSTAGLKTAAWSTLFMLELLTHRQQAPELSQSLAPGRIQRNYIQHWVSQDLATRFYLNRMLMRAGLGLSLHDGALDAARATLQLLRFKLRDRSNVDRLAKLGNE